MNLYAVDDLLTKQTLWTEEQEDQRQYIGKPNLNTTTHIRAQKYFRQFLTHTNNQAADDGAWN